jgi:hypothetical protein
MPPTFKKIFTITARGIVHLSILWLLLIPFARFLWIPGTESSIRKQELQIEENISMHEKYAPLLPSNDSTLKELYLLRLDMEDTLESLLIRQKIQKFIALKF